MRDYKGRGTNLQFRQRKRRSAAPVLITGLVLVVVVAGAILYFGGVLEHFGEPAAEQPPHAGPPGAIPLKLPPQTPGGAGNAG
jgi:hypothetical protein